MSNKGDSNVKANRASTSSESELEDLSCLDFPGDIDWSSTLVIRCDPKGGPYSLGDVTTSFYNVVRRNDVFNLGQTFLNHAFTISFRSSYAMEGFCKYVMGPKISNNLQVKGHPCTITHIPKKCVSVHVRHIPLEVDSAHIVSTLSKYGTVVKTELVKSKFRGWFHVYTNERWFTVNLKDNIGPQDLPFGLEVKGMYGGVYVEERNPKCLDCYYSGHSSDACKFKECILFKN